MKESTSTDETAMKACFPLFAASVLTVLLCNSANAELYQWKDAKGKTIFSDRPPVETQKADTVDGVEKKKEAGGKPDNDDPRSALAREEAAKKKAADKDKKLVKWRCNELEKQKTALVEKYDALVKTDEKKATAIKVDIDNHQTTIEKMCQ